MANKLTGGYAMIDCSGLDLSGSKVTIAGIYESLDKAVKANKPITAYNIEGYTPVEVVATVGDSGITATGVVGGFVVDSSDGVTPVSDESKSTKSTKSSK